jgi:FKBP-type peptidyl-prolyl cis-trans isomerase
MKKIVLTKGLFFGLSTLLLLASCSEKKKGMFAIEKLEFKNQKHELSYLIGANMAEQLVKDPNYSEYDMESVSIGFHEQIASSSKIDTSCLKNIRSMVGKPAQSGQKIKFKSAFLESGCDCIGRIFADQFKNRWNEQGILSDFDLKYVSYGFDLGLTKQDTLIKPEVKQKMLSAFQQKLKASVQSEIQKAKPEADAQQVKFFEGVRGTKGIKVLMDGIYLLPITEGSGISPKITDNVTVHYTLYDPQGQVLESSLEGGQPASFPLSGVITGWQTGLQSMKKGGKYKLFVPYEFTACF